MKAAGLWRLSSFDMQFLLALLPLLLIAMLALPGLRFKPPRRSLWVWTVVLALACGLLDALLLLLLPALRLSFGPVGLPLFALSFTRLGMLVPVLVVLLLTRKRLSKALPLFSGAIQLVLTLVAFYGFYIEPFHLGVTTFQPEEAPLFLGNRPLRILQLTDIHMEHPTRREAEILALADSLQPDVIVLTGDYINPSYLNDPVTIAETRQFLSGLHAPYGVYAVNGTVDDLARMQTLFDGLDNIRVLEDAYELQEWPGGKLALVGITNTRSSARDEQALRSLMLEVSAEAYSVLLYHTPDLIETASAANVDLYLAGHTHGGQIRLPWYGAVLTSSRYGKQYEMGAYRVGGTTLYVSRGLGMEGWGAPRVRFLCPPEIVFVDLGK